MTKVKKYLSGASLVALAQKEPIKARPIDFLPAVDELRQRGFTWRACAQWLNMHAGIEIHHTTLMRLSDGRDFIDPLEGLDAEKSDK
jgi:hypothetical protein